METVIITRKIKVKPINKDDWQKIRDVSYWSSRIANRVSTYTYRIIEHNHNCKDDKEKFKLQGYEVFKQMCIIYDDLKALKMSNVASGICKNVQDKISSDYRSIARGESVLPTFKKGYPMYLKNDHKYLGKLLTLEGYQFDFLNIRMEMIFGNDRQGNKVIIEKIRSGEYKMCDSAIQYKDKNLYLLLVVKIPKKQTALNPDVIVGADLGIKTPIAASVFGKPKVKEHIGDVKEFMKIRTQLASRIRSLQHHCKHNKGGRGRKRKMKPLEKLRGYERNYVRTKNHSYAKALIDFCLRQNAGKIVMEDLSGFNDDIKKQRFIGRYWSYFELQELIKQKAQRFNIEVYRVDPRYTSQKCSCCGHISKENRKTQKDFICVECGHEMHADINASQNIAARLKEGELITK
jgi:IS605 OrfB family transposase